jgi:sulfur-oxidizing protein SoxA
VRRALLGLLLLAVPAAAEIAPGERRSGFDQMTPELRAMQTDEAANPGQLWVGDGEEAWAAAPPTGRPACAGCHGAVATMRGVAARYPAWDEATARPVDLQGRINLCRTRHQGADPLPFESRPLLALTAAVAAQSRGLPGLRADLLAGKPRPADERHPRSPRGYQPIDPGPPLNGPTTRAVIQPP